MAHRPETSSPLNRRRFLQVSVTAAGAVSLGWYGPIRGDAQPDPEQPELIPNAYLRLHVDGGVRIFCPHGEMGQGVSTALAMLVAEELDVDWRRVEAEVASSDPARFGNQATSGSGSVRNRFVSMREAGAAARFMLVSAAAAKLQVAPEELETRDGKVIHEASGRSLEYGTLLEAAAKISPPDAVSLKRPEQFRLIGKPTPSLMLSDILAGEAIYSMDFKLPDMVYAAVARCPWFDGRLISVDATASLKLGGVSRVAEIPPVGGNTNLGPGVAVIGTSSWAALRGRDQLKIEWEPGSQDSTPELEQQMQQQLLSEDSVTVQQHGDAQAVLSSNDHLLEASYRLPFLAHMTMEPMNCTAWFHDGVMEIWSPTQAPNFSAMQVADATGLEPAAIKTHVSLMGGGFGRRLNGDFTVEAALVARQIDRPVKVIWSREDDLTHDFYRPMAGHHLKAAVGEDGLPQAWHHRLSSPAIFDLYEFPMVPAEYESVGAVDMPYRIEHRRTEFSPLESVVPRGWWRAVSTTHTVFAVESFVDELAAAAKKDPLDYRLGLIGPRFEGDVKEMPGFAFDPERMKGVLALVAEKANWGQRLPQGHGMGIACGRDHLTYAAHVIHVAADEQGLKIHRVVSAMDCGIVINPDTAQAQVQGAVIQGLSAAMMEEVTVEDGRIQQDNFDSYPIMRMDGIPESIQVHLVASAEAPTGAGECALPPVAPALTNAIFAATGQRIRRLPLSRSLKI